MRIVIDLDNTLCDGDSPYDNCTPKPGAADFLSALRADGHIIIIYTARGMGSSAGNAGLAMAKIGLLTFTQLKDWGFVYDEVCFGKPACDIFIDDKAFNSIEAFKQRHQYHS